jgi:hypothetical protein
MEELAEMIRRLHESAHGGAERRGAPRVERQGALSIRITGPKSSSKLINVRFRDCSAMGIGFNASSSLSPGTHLETVVKHPERGDLVFRYEVVRCQRMGKNLYAIGAKLLR